MAENDDKPSLEHVIADAIRAKRDGNLRDESEWETLAAELVRDIESFDLDLAQSKARRQDAPRRPAGLMDNRVVYPAIVPEDATRPSSVPKPKGSSHQAAANSGVVAGSRFLDDLRQQARERQRQLHQELAQRTLANEAIDQRLRQVFLYLHELVQQLNILRPTIERRYEIADDAQFSDLTWQEGFADFRTQSQSAGALIEMVTFSVQLASPRKFRVERSGPAIERFRKQLFDCGLRFRHNARHNSRRQVVLADFEIDAELAVSARWRADYNEGLVLVESRNLERLGNYTYSIEAAALGQELMDEFGHLVLAQPSRFREFCRR